MALQQILTIWKKIEITSFAVAIAVPMTYWQGANRRLRFAEM
jgi:hypothetical protein